MVTAGDVIFVHQDLLRPQPTSAPVAPPVEEAAEPEVQPETTAEGWDPLAEGPESYTPPPPGYAYEFGTGRLVAIRPDLIRVP